MLYRTLCVSAVHLIPVDAPVDRATHDTDILRREALIMQVPDEAVQMVAVAQVADVVVRRLLVRIANQHQIQPL